MITALLFCALVTTAWAQPERTAPNLVHIDPRDEARTSLATAVGDVPLIFTSQFFPYDRAGDLVGRADVASQTDHVLGDIEAALDVAGTDLEALARLNVYLADDSLSVVVEQQFAELLPLQARQAVTFVSGSPARPDVLVSMDAVAVAPRSTLNVDMISVIPE